MKRTNPDRNLWMLFVIVSLLAGACSNTKYLPAGESLYTGAEVKFDSANLKKSQRKALKTQLSALARPKPNSAVLGLRFKLYAWNIAGNPKKRNSPRGWLKYKVGEPPVLLSNVNLEKNTQILDNTMENLGFFQVAVQGDTIVKNKRATAKYSVRPNQQYTIKEIIFPADSSVLARAISKSAKLTLLKPGRPFNLDVVKAEYARIDADLKENGFYYFSPDYLLTKADSTIGDDKVNMYVTIKPGVPFDGKTPYTIKNVFVYTQFSLNAPGSDTSTANAKAYKGYYVVDRRGIYNPSMFAQALQFQPGDLYSRNNHNLSLNRLINLGAFKFVKNRFEKVPGDSTVLNTYYYLTPATKQALRLEFGGNTKSNNVTGSQITVGWRNRNLFKGGELLNVNATGGFEQTYAGAFKGYNMYRLGADATLTFPRFLVPILKIHTPGGFVPKTNITLGYEALNRQKLYTLNSFRTSFGYAWKESPLKEHQFNPISINYVRPWKVTQEYIDSIRRYPSLRRSIDTQFIVGSTYNYNYNQLIGAQPTNGIYFNGNVDLSGNILGLATGADIKNQDSVKIFGTTFSQYVKLEGDFRYYRKLGEKTVWASRLNAGFGYPYGNSRSLPFIKQFFIGGNNSIRAYRSRLLGPGTTAPPSSSDINKGNFYPEQSGDIKLEMNTEIRKKLFSIVYGALFVDAGNIWLYNEDQSRPGGKFTSNFLQELAVGTGAGLRFDVSILVLRLDVAFPIRKPYLPDGSRWVIDQIKFNDDVWRKDNLVFNLAIGYPF